MMKEQKDKELINSFLHAHQIETIFNEPLIPHLSLYSFEQGEIICSQGDTAQYLYVLVEGKLKIYTTSAEGNTLILSFKTPLEVIGDIEYLRDIDIINTVEAVTPVHMIGVHYSYLEKYSKDYSPLLQFLLDIITRKFTIKSQSLSFHLFYPVEVRLASYLLSVSVDESDPLFNEHLSINIKDTANLIGTSYRHLNRVIGKFCTEGLIERNKGRIFIVNREGLRMMAGKNIYE